MKIKIFYILITVALCLVFFAFGWFLHKPGKQDEVAQNDIVYGPDFNQDQPYLPFIYEKCPVTNIPEEQTCAINLFYSTQKEADVLADKLSQKGNDLRTKIQAVQQLNDNYINNYCALDTMLISGGTGQIREEEACRYYHENQYLELFKALEKSNNQK